MCDLFCLKVPYKCIIDHKRKQSFYLGHLKLRSSCLKFYPHILQPHKHWCAATAVDANTDKISKCQWHGCQKQGVWGVLWASVLQNLFFSDFFVCLPISLQLVYSLYAKGVSKSVQITVTVKHPGFDSEGLKTSKIKSKFSHTVNLLRCIPLSFPCLMRHFLWKSG